MTQTTAAGAAAAARDLEARGHHVTVCHPDGTAACVALSGGECPLDRGTVDAVVVIRPFPAPDALALESGAYCAARRGVPLVVGGCPEDSPFAHWASAEEDGSDVAITVETVVGLPLPRLSHVATQALQQALAASGAPSPRARVEVRRRHGGVVAELIGATTDLPSAQVAMASVRVAGAIRGEDRWVRRIDVTSRSPRTHQRQAATPPASTSSSRS